MRELEQYRGKNSLKGKNFHGYNTHDIYETNFINWIENGYYNDIYDYEGWDIVSFIIDNMYRNLYIKHYNDTNEKEFTYFL